MTTTSENYLKDGRPILYHKGEYLVTTVIMKDDSLVNYDGQRKSFAMYHVPTGVMVATGSMLAGMIQSCYALDEQLKEARAKPEQAWEEMSADGAPTGGFKGF